MDSGGTASRSAVAEWRRFRLVHGRRQPESPAAPEHSRAVLFRAGDGRRRGGSAGAPARARSSLKQFPSVTGGSLPGV